ncbi:hypothetical protein S83_062106 [Arachis hypogaea]
MDSGRFRYYVVRRGRKPGIYTSWEECNQQVYGFKGSQLKGFMVRREAEEWLSLPRQHPVGEDTVPEPQDLALSFGAMSVGDSGSVTGDDSSGSVTAGTDLLPQKPDMVPEFDPKAFVIMEDMEQLLLRVCARLEIGPPVFFMRDVFRSKGKKYHGFGVSLQSTAKGIHFFVSGWLSLDEGLARQDAAFITLERLLEEAEVKIFYFNFQVVLRYKEALVEAHRIARLSATEHVMMLEKENAALKQRLSLYNQMFM